MGSVAGRERGHRCDRGAGAACIGPRINVRWHATDDAMRISRMLLDRQPAATKFDRGVSRTALCGRLALACVVSCALLACGPYPPSVADRGDVESLSTDTHSLHARSLADDDIPALGRLVNLDYLSFSSGWARNDITTGFKPWRAAITDRGLARLAELDLPKLDVLDLGHCESITDAGMADVARMTQVRSLDLRNTAITDEGLAALTRMQNLTWLTLDDCPGITDRGLELLARKSNWAHVWVSACPNVTQAGIARLQAALPNCVLH